MMGTADDALIPRESPGFGQRLKFAVKVNHTVLALTVPFGTTDRELSGWRLLE